MTYLRGAGYPYHVRVSSPATLTLNTSVFSATANLSLGGDLTIDSGATVDVSYYRAPVIVNGNLINSGN